MKPRLMDVVLDSWGKVGEGADLVIVEGADRRPRSIFGRATSPIWVLPRAPTFR